MYCRVANRMSKTNLLEARRLGDLDDFESFSNFIKLFRFSSVSLRSFTRFQMSNGYLFKINR